MWPLRPILVAALGCAASVAIAGERPCPREPVEAWSSCLAQRRAPGAFRLLQAAARAIVTEDGAGAVLASDFEAIVRSAGDAFAEGDADRLAAGLRSRELGELAFSLGAVRGALDELRQGRPGSGTKAARVARWKALARTARPACTAAAGSERGELRRLGRDCLAGIDEPDPIFFETRRPPRAGDRSLLATLGRGGGLTSVFGPGGLGGDASGAIGTLREPGDPAPSRSCLRNAIPWIELCLPEGPGVEHPAASAELLLRSMPRERDSTANRPYWLAVTAAGTRDHLPVGDVSVPLDAPEALDREGVAVQVVGALHVIVLPVVRGAGPNHRRARVVLVPFDATARTVGEPWRSPPCVGACKLPSVAAAKDGSDLTVTLGRLDGAGERIVIGGETLRLRSEGGRLTPIAVP